MLSLGTIRSRYYEAARRAGAPKRLIMFATQPRQDGGAYVECDETGYAYVVWERGAELHRRKTTDPDEILYWLISDVTVEMALEYELAHRQAGQDSRRQWFQKHLELLALANPEWSKRKRREYDKVLQENPFDDTPAA
jgi:hypothetical protein